MKRSELLGSISRRRVLHGVGAATIGGGIVSHQLTESVSGWGDTEFVIQQGDECIPIEPLSDLGDIVDLYGYESDASAKNSQQSNTGLEKASVSRVFLYDGPNGFSIVFLQGGNDDEGGAASFLVCGLSADGKWVVLDDEYDGAIDQFHTGDHEAVLNWTWGSGGRNDGAVFRGLDKKFCVTIRPAFNEAAKLDPSGSGEVTSWQVLSGNADDPDVIDLDIDESLTVRTGSCESKDHASACTMRTRTVTDPFDAEVTFCCTAAAVEADSYDAVYLNFLDGTDQKFDGPFEGFRGFLANDDDDQNANDEIIRSVVIKRGDDRVKVKNPGFDRCRELIDEGKLGGDDEGYGGKKKH